MTGRWMSGPDPFAGRFSSIYPLLLAYEEEARHGVEQKEWLAAGERFGGFLLDVQGEDGSWHRGYSRLSAPEDTAFSGAVNKRKGDDNDTCNRLVNAQALYGLDALRDTYGTLELSEIRRLTSASRKGFDQKPRPEK